MLAVTDILLVRHGESVWNATGRWQGWADPPLSELGRRQARLAAAAVTDVLADAGTDVAAVVSSDLRRAHDTARILTSALGLGPVSVEPDLRERHVGEWTGLTRSDIEARWTNAARLLAPPRRPPGGERIETFTDRVLGALERVAGRHRGVGVLAVAHGGVIRTVERHLHLAFEPLPNLGGLWVSIDGGGLAAGGRVLLLDPSEVPVTAPSPR